jgi:intracellular septation protein
MTDTTATAVKPSHPAWLPAALDYGPLVAFFVGYKVSGVIVGTGVFMVAIALAVLISKLKLKRVSPMMWISAILVIVFGGLTIYLRDERFIQIKPTIVYTILAGMLFVGLMRGKPLLKYVLEHGYAGLSEAGWMLLSRNWAWFFAAMALLNEALRYTLTFDTWLTVKVWGITLLSIVFAAANIPMLMRHGLGEEEPAAAG